MQISGRNKLAGTVVKVTPGIVTGEVRWILETATGSLV